MKRHLTKESGYWQRLLVRFFMVVGTIALIVWAMPRDNQTNFKIERGKPWRYADFTAPFDFPIYKTEALIQKERDSLLKSFEPYYNYNTLIGANHVKQFLQDYRDGIPEVPSSCVNIITNILTHLYAKGIMNLSEYNSLSVDSSKMVRVVIGKNASSIPVKKLYSTVRAYELLMSDEHLAPYHDQLAKCNLNDYVVSNLIYDKDRSDASLEDQLGSIPLAVGVAQRGEKIIDRGDIVDEKTYNKLLSYQKEMERQNVDQEKIRLNIMGQILYTAILITCFTIFLTLFRKDYFEKVRSTTMLYALIVIFTIIASMMVKHSVLHVYIVPFAMVPIFIRVFMDSRTAFMALATMILTCACFLQYPLEFVAVELVAGLVAIFSLRELSSRSQLFWTAVSVTIAAVLTNLALDWIRINDLSKISYSEYNYLVINGILLFCSYPLLYVIEKAFGFTSNITLIELSDMNKALLRKMSEVAPGTFQHSIQVGNLAAEIANKIGAKSQLVRTGALYHDIGKIANPIYFTENQSGVNPHEKMEYIESAQMIISHVTEGTKLADKYNLPDVIKDFITTHHGLGKTKYFYVQYKNAHQDEEVDDLLFTYPGPNPFTKEQAILMMADTVEAASRSLPDYTEKSIRELVERLIDTQVAEGYFKECPITFRDIAYAKTVLIEKLKTIYHTRLSYPELKK